MESKRAYLYWLDDLLIDVVCADGTVPQTGGEILMALAKTYTFSMAATH